MQGRSTQNTVIKWLKRICLLDNDAPQTILELPDNDLPYEKGNMQAFKPQESDSNINFNLAEEVRHDDISPLTVELFVEPEEIAADQRLPPDTLPIPAVGTQICAGKRRFQIVEEKEAITYPQELPVGACLCAIECDNEGNLTDKGISIPLDVFRNGKSTLTMYRKDGSIRFQSIYSILSNDSIAINYHVYCDGERSGTKRIIYKFEGLSNQNDNISQVRNQNSLKEDILEKTQDLSPNSFEKMDDIGMDAIIEVFSDPIFDSFRSYCEGKNMIFINDLDDYEIDLFRKIYKPTEEEFLRVITKWEKAKVTYNTDFNSKENTGRVQLIQKMEKYFKENSLYISAELATRLSDDEVKIVKAYPDLFFKCTGKRAVLVKWIIIELDRLFVQRQISFLVLEVIYEHLFNYLNIGFHRESLEKLLETDNFITHKKFLVIRDKYLKIYYDVMDISSDELTQPIDFKPPSQPGSRLTIKEAIICVLEAELHSMTVEQIYDKIIADKLYSFGAQNPQNVVRVEIDRACVNSNYTLRASKECFRFERNEKGEKVYFLLSKKMADIEVGAEVEPTELLTSRTENIDIWNGLIERKFQMWLEQEDYAAKTAQTYSRPTDSALVAPPKPTLDPAVIEQLTDVLSAHFSNGYRLNSPIEMARFRSFAANDLDEELTLSDDELKNYIAACGTTYESKVYAVSPEAKEQIRELAEEYFADGAQAIFFAEFYAKNENWLFGASVVSEDMLIGILRRLFPKLSFTQTYFGYTDASIFAALEREILRVWDGNVLMTYNQLAERLQYIPLDRIKYALSQNGDFIWGSVETFSHISRVKITDEEKQAIREAAVRECNARCYASVTDLPFGEIGERNYELSITAVHNAIYRMCLSDKFDKKGKIVTRKGDVFDALTITKEYCRTIDKCSLNDLLNFEKELTGEVHRWIPMEAGNAVLVRIDKDTYVADRYVHFNAEVIDEAIGLVVKGDYLPLKSFTTFGAFPDCGQTWNLFLLESYCRRFSHKFRFDTPSVNSRNAGAVIHKSCGMDYTEIMTDAVANADVPLKDTAVGRFLFDSGYTGRSTNAKVGEIIDKAKAIRERRD